jgi:hypothetical protein
LLLASIILPILVVLRQLVQSARHKNGGGEKDAATLEASQSTVLSALSNAGATGERFVGALDLLSSASAASRSRKSPVLLLLLPPRLKNLRLQLSRTFAGQLF